MQACTLCYTFTSHCIAFNEVAMACWFSSTSTTCVQVLSRSSTDAFLIVPQTRNHGSSIPEVVAGELHFPGLWLHEPPVPPAMPASTIGTSVSRGLSWGHKMCLCAWRRLASPMSRRPDILACGSKHACGTSLGSSSSKLEMLTSSTAIAIHPVLHMQRHHDVHQTSAQLQPDLDDIKQYVARTDVWYMSTWCAPPKQQQPSCKYRYALHCEKEHHQLEPLSWIHWLERHMDADTPVDGLAPGRGGPAALARHPAVPRLAQQQQRPPRAAAAELWLLHCSALHCPAIAIATGGKCCRAAAVMRIMA